MRFIAGSHAGRSGARDILGAQDAQEASWLLMARPLMALWIGGGALAELWLALYGGHAARPWVALAPAVAAQALGVLVGASTRRVPPAWTGHAILLAATTAISLLLWGTGSAGAGLGLLYLWATPYAFILLRPGWAVAHVALAGAAWTAAQALNADAVPRQGDWLATVATLTAISLVSGYLITSLHRSRQLLNRAFEDAPLGLAFADVAGNWIGLNRSLRALLGRSGAALTGTPVADLLGDVADAEPRRLPCAGDGRTWIEVVRSPVRDDAGGLVCWSLEVSDVTARHDAEAALRVDAAQARWIDEVRAALAEDRIVLHAQPLVDIRSGRPVGHEILARLQQRDGTIVMPARFMPAVERFGLAPQFDAHILERAARIAAAGWPLHVNLSAQSVGRPETIAALQRALRDAGAAPSLLTLEITETALSDDLEACVAFGREIVALGCRLALDDFGTGYGTLTYLASLPVSEIKIDRRFVGGLVTDPGSVEIVRAVVGLARSFRATTVAEGVEDEDVLAIVRELGVDVVQGFLLGRPAPVEVALAAVRQPAAVPSDGVMKAAAAAARLRLAPAEGR